MYPDRLDLSLKLWRLYLEVLRQKLGRRWSTWGIFYRSTYKHGVLVTMLFVVVKKKLKKVEFLLKKLHSSFTKVPFKPLLKGTVKEKRKGIYAETYAFYELFQTHESSI